jgi:hypothetical protein
MMSAVKLWSKRPFTVTSLHLLQPGDDTATLAASPEASLPQRPSIELVPAASPVTEADRVCPDGDAVSSLQEEPPERDLRWLGSLICMVTAFASASAIVWILL